MQTHTPSSPKNAMLEILVWAFGIIVSLFPVGWVLALQYLKKQPFSLDGIVAEGRLLFFATTFVTVSYFIPFIRLINAGGTGTLVMGAISTATIAFISGNVYSNIISGITLAPDRLKTVSVFAVIGSLLTSFCIKLRALRL